MPKGKGSTSSVLRLNVGRTINLGVIYVDIVGSTLAVSQMSPASVAEYYESFTNEMTRVVYDFGGHVLKHVGDSVVGFFPAIHGFVDATDHTIVCGMIIHEVVDKSLSPHLVGVGLPPIRCRVGADFGSAQVVRLGVKGLYIQTDIVGHTMNVAAKIMAKAQAGEFYIGHELRSLVHGVYRPYCTKVGQLQLNPPYPYYKVSFPLP